MPSRSPDRPAVSVRWPFRLSAVLKASVLCLASVLFAAGAQAAEKRPNVVLLVWDTTRADHLSLYLSHWLR